MALSPANAGAVPATVTVPAGQLSATLDYTDSKTVKAATLTVTLGASALTAAINIVSLAGGLVINEKNCEHCLRHSAARSIL